MSVLRTVRIAAEIYGLSAGLLVAVSALIATGRTIFEKKQPPFTYPIDVPKAEAKAAAEGYLHRALVALDIFLNVVVMGGRQCETMSSHAFIASLEGKLWGKLMNKWLNGFQPQHGPQAASGDLERSTVEAERLKKVLKIS